MKKIILFTLMLAICSLVIEAQAQSARTSKTKAKTEKDPSAVSPAKPQPASEVAVETPADQPAQETVTSTPRPKAKPGAVIVKPAPQQETVQPVNDKKLKQRMHAEERSNGNAFSGKGKGGEKNLVDPVNKTKKNKKKFKNEVKKAK